MTYLLAATAAIALAFQAQPQASDEDSSATSAETAGGAAMGAAEAKEEDKEKSRIICKRTAITGSKFKKRLCGTKEEWETLRRQSSDNTDEMQRRGKGVDPSGR